HAARFAREQHQSGIVESYPDAAGVILENGIGFVAGKAVLRAVGRENIILAEPAQAAAGARPDVPFTVFKYTLRRIALPAHVPGGKGIALHPRHTVAGCGPDIAVPVFRQRPDHRRFGPVAPVILNQGTGRETLDQTRIAGQPEMVVAIDQHSDGTPDAGPGIGCRLNKSALLQSGHASCASYPEDAVLVDCQSTDSGEGEIMVGR